MSEPSDAQALLAIRDDIVRNGGRADAAVLAGLEYLATRGAGVVSVSAGKPYEDARQALAYLITAHRMKERGLGGFIGEAEIAVARPLADFLTREGFNRYWQSDSPRPITEEMVEAAARDYHERGNGPGSFERMADHVRASLLSRMGCALRAAEEARR